MRGAFLAMLVWLGTAAGAHATADGPDFFRVTGVAANDVLNLRAGPAARAAKIGEIPHDADGLTNFGCVGGMSFAEYQEATAAEREAAVKSRWCRVMHGTQIGWVAGRFLTEGAEGDRPGTRALLEHAGTEWKLVAFASGTPGADVLVRFAARNEITGGAGCNRFTGTYVQRGLDVLIGDLAMTRMMCPEDVMATEARVIDVLARARGIAGGLYTMALFSGDGALLATFRRTDWD